MSLIKGKQEFRTILDFHGKLSKNKIREALRHAEVQEVVYREDDSVNTFVENLINVGMYQVRLIFSSLDAGRNRSRLREYGKFRVGVYERTGFGKSMHNISLAKDRRFKNQYWVDMNKDYNLRINNLIDIIMYLHRLNNLKVFL